MIDDDTTEVMPPQCIWCNTPPEPIKVRVCDLMAWKSGQNIQRAFPEMPKERRELLISGTHSDCWDRLFAEEE